MVRYDKNLIATPRRRVSLRNAAGTISKVAKVLSQPAANTIPIPTVSNMTVVVRVRPPNRKENETRTVVKVVDDKLLVFDPKEEEEPFFYRGVKQRDFLKKTNKEMKFIFDKVCGNSSSNVEVYSHSTKRLVNTLMSGYNCSVFAYGATGAGKTFTMLGTEESPGITYLTMKDLFDRKEELSTERDFELMLTYVEIYNEVVKDLLAPGGAPLYLREDSKYGVIISGVKVHKIKSPEELFLLLEQGNKRRTQHLTDANAESSRSHAVFQVYIQMTLKSTREVSTAKLSMIDLAGSERGSATGYVGPRFKEGANINRSLLALGNCINSLINGKKHIPYRDSKLTRLLKDSLGGNCHTVMIANVSPSLLSYEETYNTLKYAFRAKSIKSNVKKNIVNADLHVEQYIKLVSDLQTENTNLKAEIERLRQVKEPEKPFDYDTLVSEHAAMKKEVEILNMTINALRTEKGEGDGPCSLPSPEVKSQVGKVALQDFVELVEEQKKVMQAIFAHECALLSLKRQFEEETEKRNVTTSRNKGETMKESRDRQRAEQKKIQSLIEECRLDKNRAYERLSNLLVIHPELHREYEKFDWEVKGMESRFKTELAQMENDILIQKLSRFQANFMNKRRPLTRSDATTPGTSHSGDATSSSVKPKERNNGQTFPGRAQNKSKKANAESKDMDSTFVKDNAPKTQTKAKTRQFAVKGYKTRTSKRFVLSTLPGGKENKPALKKSAKRQWM